MLCGLEIHQRLSGRKLFNKCPTPSADEPLDEGSVKFSRKLFTSKSELGKTDTAAKFEKSRGLNFFYSAPNNFCCLVDSDEEPPSNMSREALLSVLKFCKSCNATIVDEIQVMRKMVLDGSNPSGFQRTSLVALGGTLTHSGGEIALETICIEEESAGIVEKVAGSSSYRLDRMGVPLIEIATAPVFKSAKDAAAGALAIGQKLRMLENVMRGLGTIRQDVNISIEGGDRVEVKGLQDIKMLETLVENEVKRQEGIVAIKKELKTRGFERSTPKILDLGKIFEKSECKITLSSLKSGGVVLGVKIPFYSGLLGYEFYLGRRFGSELSDYAKMAGGVRGLIHSDEDMSKYKISTSEFQNISSALGLGKNDAFILIADKKERAEPAILAAFERSQILGVVKETRKADENGGSSFMRPMAGAHRMYPETDLRPIKITKELLRDAGELETIESRRENLHSLLGKEMGGRMLMSYNYPRFIRMVNSGADAKLLANILEQTLVALRREGVGVEQISDEYILGTIELFEKNKITKAAMDALLKLGVGRDDVSLVASEKNLFRISGKKLLELWESEGGDLKKFMGKYRLIVDGKEIMGLAKKN